MGKKWHTQWVEEKKMKQKRVITHKTYDVINRWHSVDDAKMHADKMALCAQIQIKLPIRWAVWRHIRTKNTYFINFHLSLRHNKNEAKEQKIRRTNTCLVMIWFFPTVWQNDKQTKKTRTQSHSHSTTELLKNCFYLQTYRAYSSLHGV